ncbi:MAG: hypothetical protein GY733_14610 [bacterium]|nr:hypothetical protein [bacterium]
METRPPPRIDSLALLLACLLLATPAFAQNPCVAANGEAAVLLADADSGISGTGRAGGDESGLGGTGRSGGDESGFGGTGYSGGDESGIGGTGVFGTITAFGSICVNGLRVHYDQQTPIYIDGQPAAIESLAIGQVVAVQATGHGDELQALHVEIRRALEGPVNRIDAEAGLLYVMDSPVALNPEALAAGPELRVGTRVSVSGLRRGDGVVVASRLASAGEGERDSISGIVRRNANAEFTVGGTRISYAGEPDEGEFVHVTGRYVAAQGIFEAATVSRTPLLDPDVERLSVEGYLQELKGDGRVFLPGVEVERDSLERAVDPTERTHRVRITGRRDGLGRLRVERVHRVERPRVVRDLRPAKRDRPARRTKPQKKSKPGDRPDRPPRPTVSRPTDRPDRPPRIDRPPKVDRPSVIDSNVRQVRDLR